MNKNVFITKYACISPLGTDKKTFKENLMSGNSCISSVPAGHFPLSFPVKLLGIIPGQILEPDYKLDSPRLIEQKTSWIKNLFSEIKTNSEIDTIILVHNTGVSPVSYYHFVETKKNTLFNNLSNSQILPQDFIDELKLKKAVTSDCQIINFHNTCSSVSAAVTYASKRLKLGLDKKTLIIAFENSNNNWLTMISLHNLGVVSKAESKEKGILPFSVDRNGFVKADALGFLLLESEPENDPLSEVLSGKISSDSHSLTDGIEDGSMVGKTINACLEEAQISASQISYINAHGSGTFLNDLIESRGLKNAFGEHLEKIPVSSTKSQFGHALCATGVVEISAIMAMFEEKFIAANSHCSNEDKSLGLNIVKAPAYNISLEYVLKNSFGFGGYNSSIILKNLVK